MNKKEMLDSTVPMNALNANGINVHIKRQR